MTGDASAGSPNLIQRFDAWLGREATVREALATYAAAAVLLGFLLVPVFTALLATIVESSVFLSGRIVPAPDQVTFQRYVAVATDPRFLRYALNSAVIATATTLLTLTCGGLAAYGVSRYDFPGRGPLLLGFLTSQMLPWVLILLPFYVLMFQLNLVNTFPGIVLAHTAVTLPVAIWLLKGYFDNVPTQLIEAAKMDGCSELDVFVRIVAPVARPGLVVAGFYTFTFSWNDFLFVSVLSQTPHTWTLALALGFSQGQTVSPTMLTRSVLMFLPPLVLFALVRDRIVAGFVPGGVNKT